MLLFGLLGFTLLLFFLIFGWYLSQLPKTPDAHQDSKQVPKVSVLLAARNEADNIRPCLEALNNLRYPADRLEVLIGDDRSEDQTRALIQAYIADKPYFRLVDVTYDWGKARSKGNVLAWLAHEASGEYYFITDADIRVPPDWIHGLLNGFGPGIGVVSGISVVKGSQFFGKMQGLEWRYYMTLVRLTAEAYPITAIGNNMAVSRDAYWHTGGYQNLESSVTEDYKIFQEVTRLGWRSNHIMNTAVLGISEPTRSLWVLLHQRKRWLRGGMALPKPILGLMIVHGLFVPSVLVLLLIAPWWALGAASLRLGLQSVFIAGLSRNLSLPVVVSDLLWFEPYHYFTELITPVYFFLPTKLEWKNREI